MCSLAVGSASCSVCVNRKRLRCTIPAAALQTASSYAPDGLHFCHFAYFGATAKPTTFF